MEKTMEETKDVFIVGQKIDWHYLNGKFVSVVEVEKTTDKSVWVNGSRQSWNTIRDYYSLDIYRIHYSEEEIEDMIDAELSMGQGRRQ